MDQSINFPESSLNYIISTCDSDGNLSYQKLLKDMVIRTVIDLTGSINI